MQIFCKKKCARASIYVIFVVFSDFCMSDHSTYPRASSHRQPVPLNTRYIATKQKKLFIFLRMCNFCCNFAAVMVHVGECGRVSAHLKNIESARLLRPFRESLQT